MVLPYKPEEVSNELHVRFLRGETYSFYNIKEEKIEDGVLIVVLDDCEVRAYPLTTIESIRFKIDLPDGE